MRVSSIITYPAISGTTGSGSGGSTGSAILESTSFVMSEGVSVSSTLAQSGTFRMTVHDATDTLTYAFLDGRISKDDATLADPVLHAFDTNMLGITPTSFTDSYTITWPSSGFITVTFSGVTAKNNGRDFVLELRSPWPA